MAEYIDRDELLKELCTVSAPTPSESWIVERCIEKVNEQPTADVVPKSEVERLEREVKLLTENTITAKYPCHVLCSKGVILTKSLEEYDKLLGDIASEVAREIFEDIDGKISCFFPASSFVNAPNTTYYSLIDMLAELKKKYTEEKK